MLLREKYSALTLFGEEIVSTCVGHPRLRTDGNRMRRGLRKVPRR